jgi:hypothetical protein
MAVGGLDRVCVDDVDLVLAAAELAFRELDRDARCVHPVADLADDPFILRGLEDVIVLDVFGVRPDVAVIA